MRLFVLFLLHLNYAQRKDYEWKMGYGNKKNKVVRLKSNVPQELLKQNFKGCFINIINIFVFDLISILGKKAQKISNFITTADWLTKL